MTHKDVWETLEYFLREVTPVAENAGVKLVLHPDDSPHESLRKTKRIVDSMQAYDRMLDAYGREYNGITFCQSDFVSMSAGISNAIEHFGDRINVIHFRDVEGDAERFVETCHDDGLRGQLKSKRPH